MQSALTFMFAIILAFTFTLDADNNAVVTGYEGELTEFAVPPTLNGYPVAAIGDEAFYDCDTIVSVVLPEGLRFIGYDAFSGCDSLLTVALPASLEAIDTSAFSGCDQLTLLVIEDSYAHAYAEENGIPNVFSGASD